MRLPWNKAKEIQLDLLDAPAHESSAPSVDDEVLTSGLDGPSGSPASAQTTPIQANPASANDGRPLLVSVTRLFEDPNNPRTEFPEADVEELAIDMRQRGVLQPLVVHPADDEGRYRIHFGAKRLRAAMLAGLQEIPVVVRDLPADPYAQVAENQKRHGLTPLELARFIRAQVDLGESNAAIAKQLGINLTTVAHHLTLLELPPELDEAFKSGRCTSPRTLHELSKLRDAQPEQVQSLLASGAEITRVAVSALRAASSDAAVTGPVLLPLNKLIAEANAACARLERALNRIQLSDAHQAAAPEWVALRVRVETIHQRWLQGSDRQTPSQNQSQNGHRSHED